MELCFFDRMAVLSAVQEIQQAEAPKRRAALYELTRILGANLPGDVISPPEAGASFEAAFSWVVEQRKLQLEVRYAAQR